MRRDALLRALEAVPDFPASNASLEQYKTPAHVAADLLWEAHQDGCVKGKDVLDLGCGTGIFAHGAQLLGATVTGIDLDADALAIAAAQTPGEFLVGDVATMNVPKVDTVLMNPPFGSQKKHADRVFYQRAVEAVADRHGSIWFVQQPVNERFLHAWFKEHKMQIERVCQWAYPLEARFDFHRDGVKTIPVGGYAATF